MNDELLQIPCQLVKQETRALSKDCKLTFVTQEEVPPELLTPILSKIGKTGWLSFLVGERRIDTLDVVTLPELQQDKGEKTKAQRLRNVLYVLWESEGKPGTSEEFYNIKMEQFIDFVKEKLPKD